MHSLCVGCEFYLSVCSVVCLWKLCLIMVIECNWCVSLLFLCDWTCHIFMSLRIMFIIYLSKISIYIQVVVVFHVQCTLLRVLGYRQQSSVKMQRIMPHRILADASPPKGNNMFNCLTMSPFFHRILLIVWWRFQNSKNQLGESKSLVLKSLNHTNWRI